MSAWQADILMYHSISDAPGPTSIAPEVFKAQMQALADSGLPVVTPDALANPPAPRVVIISFDDGFEDFADTAWPILRDHGFCPIVYLPSGRMGGNDSWAGGNIPARPLMGWDRVETLAAEGVCFGAHSVTHPDLTTLDALMLEEEVSGSGQDIAARLGQPTRHFAPPYGASNSSVLRQVAQHYDTSVGTRLGVAKAGDDMHDLPRLEMFYFNNIARWKAHLAGRGGPYLTARRAMRGIRAMVRGKSW
ncbi:polysaccharide deacetylase family protein [Sulfitobacter sp. M22298]|uniref:polysaccharide deacetylase family protein n=1 Tax=Sulfitobacter sp. M22298 TaxID=3368575 RepID=UPI003747093A